jgi:hypothetical protein
MHHSNNSFRGIVFECIVQADYSRSSGQVELNVHDRGLSRSPSHLHISMVGCNQVDRYLPAFAFAQSIDFAYAQTSVCSHCMYMLACRMPCPPYVCAVASLTPMENRKLVSCERSKTLTRTAYRALVLNGCECQNTAPHPMVLAASIQHRKSRIERCCLSCLQRLI